MQLQIVFEREYVNKDDKDMINVYKITLPPGIDWYFITVRTEYKDGSILEVPYSSIDTDIDNVFREAIKNAHCVTLHRELSHAYTQYFSSPH